MEEWTFASSLNPLQNAKFQFLDLESGQTQDWYEADDVMLGGESSMLNISEAPKETSSCHNEGEGYGLSQILLKSTDVPKKYFLSAKACLGIIKRSEKRNKPLPPILKKALKMQAGVTNDDMSIVGGQMYDITHADDVVRETDKSPTLNARIGTGGNQVPIMMGNIPSEKNGIITYDVKTTVKVRRHEVDIDAMKIFLRDALTKSGLSKKDIAERLDVPQTQVDHYFRQDKYFSIPDADVWMELKQMLGIETDEFDKQIMEFDEVECNFDTANRIYDAQGISPTITSVNADRMVLQSEKLMSTTGVHCEPIYSIGHDERSAGLKPNVVDPLTRKDYLRCTVVAQPIADENAYCIGDGQVHQTYLQGTVGALNCMNNGCQKVMQEIDGGGTDNEDRKVQCLNPQFSKGEKIYHQNGNYPTLRSGSDTGGRGYPNAYVMQEQDVWTSSRAGFWLDFTKNVTNSLVAGGYKGQNIVAVAEKEQDEHID